MEPKLSSSVNGGLIRLLEKYCVQEKIDFPLQYKHYEPQDRVPFSEWKAMLHYIHKKSNKPLLGLKIGELVEPGHLGIMAYLGWFSSTLLEAMPIFLKYHRLAVDITDMTIGVESDMAMISWGKSEEGIDIGLLADELHMSIFITALKRLVYPHIPKISRVQFIQDRPRNFHAYEDYFQCPVDFGVEHTTVISPLSTLSLPIQHADAILIELLKKQAEVLMAELPDYNTFDQQVQQNIIYAVHHNHVNVDYVAQRMGLSRRIFQRKLGEHGYTFNDRLSQVRIELAKQYLKDQSLSISDISLLLAYEEQTSFQRAFKKWTGSSPLQWRKIDIDERW